MLFHVHVRTETTAGPWIAMNCPWCGSVNAPAQIFELRETMVLFFVASTGARSTVVVKCERCGQELYSKVAAAELVGISPANLERYLYKRVSLPLKAVALFGLLLSWVPLVGLPLALIALIWSRGLSHWARRVSIIATTVGAIANAWFIYYSCTH